MNANSLQTQYLENTEHRGGSSGLFKSAAVPSGGGGFTAAVGSASVTYSLNAKHLTLTVSEDRPQLTQEEYNGPPG